MPLFEKHFNDLGEFADFVKGCNSKNSDYVDTYPDKWSGDCTWDEALQFLETGHQPGLAKVSAAVDQLRYEVEPVIDNYYFEQQGLMLDVGTFLTGEPEHWLETSPQKERKVYRILVHIGMLASVDQKAMRNRGASLVALIDKLQSDPANIVDLQVVSYAGDCIDRGNDVKITIDMGTTPLDMDAVSFVLAHPSFFRMLCFGARELLTGKKYGTGDSGIGHTKQIPQKDIPENTIYFHGGSKDFVDPINNDFKTLDRAGKWINQKLKNLFKNGRLFD